MNIINNITIIIMTILLDLLFCIFVLFYIPYVVIKKKWHKDFPQRFGKIPQDICRRLEGRDVIWVHAVSVGEVQAATRLIREMKQAFTDKVFVITTVTTTGNALAHKNFSDDSVLYAPLDFSFFIKAYLKAVNPSLYIAAETEIWPNLFHHLSKRAIPIAIVNGRISDKSYGRYKKFRWLFKSIVTKVTLFCMQTQTDVQRIVDLGAEQKSVYAVGNLKFDDCVAAESGSCYQDLFEGRSGSVFVAGSTHPGEEEIVIDVFKRLKHDFSDLKCVLVPRHIERAPQVFDLIQASGLSVDVFSQLTDFRSHNDIVLVDTIGHLRDLYALADVVFVGKSLVGHGGQNIIEPASFGKPVIVGPFMENFRSVMQAFEAGEAVLTVRDMDELYVSLKQLLSYPSEAQRLGACGRSVVESQSGAVQRTLSLLKDRLSV